MGYNHTKRHKSVVNWWLYKNVAGDLTDEEKDEHYAGKTVTINGKLENNGLIHFYGPTVLVLDNNSRLINNGVLHGRYAP